MAMYAWAELIKLWELERLSTEQVIGQLLQQGQQQSSALAAVQRRQDGLEQLLAAPQCPRDRFGSATIDERVGTLQKPGPLVQRFTHNSSISLGIG